MPLQAQRGPSLDLLDLNLVDVDLLVEHDGHKLKLNGSDSRFVARLPTLVSLFHFGGLFWSLRKRIPQQASLHMEWRPFRVLLKRARGKDAIA